MKAKEATERYGVNLMLELIQTSKVFYEAYIKKYPDNTANALSYSKNPNCSCRGKLTKHYQENTNDVNIFVQEFLDKNPSEIDIPKFVENYEKNKTTSVSGRIVRVPKNDQSYGQLVAQINREGWSFRHMSVGIDAEHYVFFFV